VAGNDTINSKDGQRDIVECDAGKDRVKADKKDVLHHCEIIVKSAAHFPRS